MWASPDRLRTNLQTVFRVRIIVLGSRVFKAAVKISVSFDGSGTNRAQELTLDRLYQLAHKGYTFISTNFNQCDDTLSEAVSFCSRYSNDSTHLPG